MVVKKVIVEFENSKPPWVETNHDFLGLESEWNTIKHTRWDVLSDTDTQKIAVRVHSDGATVLLYYIRP